MIRIYRYGEVPTEEILARRDPVSDVAGTVADILTRVRREGDAALLAYTEKFDGAVLTALEVTPEEKQQAWETVDPAFRDILTAAAKNIRAFHSKQVRSGFRFTGADGVVLGQKVTPIEKVGLYVPGGTAAYPSTVLMDSIPAKLAGCAQLVMTTPPGRDGRIAPEILAAAAVAGVDRVFKVGGAQAIAALAYGTESVPRVDKIVGPGNAYVAEAKKQVFGSVSIDMIAGPSEILVVADGTCEPVYVAADLLSQAEHDRNASAVLVTDDEGLARRVQAELERQLPELPRAA
ncbi:MAG: histidinol dehydrogenase [Eubacteriales bacterium]|nr:histidinol dehydrogenase [Eubacteriales bacterium]